MRLNFTDPRGARFLEAEVEPWLTGREAIEALVIAGFIQESQPGQSSVLVIPRTNQQITPNMEFGQRQLMEGEVIQVFQPGLAA